MRRWWWGAAAVALAGAVVVAGTQAGSAAPASASPAAERVLVLAYPRVTWDLVAEVRPPALLGLLGRSAVASLSVQAAGARTNAEDGYLTAGAGNRTSVEVATGSVQVRQAGPSAVEVQPFGDDLDPGNRYGAEPGALGDALGAAGRSAAVVANADVVTDAGGQAGTIVEHREAALAIADRAGRAGGDVTRALAVDDPVAPGGLRVDTTAVVDAFRAAWQPGATVLVELSDLDRADRDGDRADLAAALLESDRTTAQLLRDVDLSRDLVLVVAPVAPHDRAELTVFAVAGPGVEAGEARSATTRRAGYVTLPDVAPTILTALGVEVPDAMTGTPITSAGGPTLDAARARALADRDARSRFREQIVVPVSVVFLALQLLVYLATAQLFRRDRWRPVLRVGLLAVLAFPLVTFASGLVAYERLGGIGGYVAAVLAVAFLVGGVVRVVTRGHGAWGALGVVLATWSVLVVDAVRSGPLQLDTPFGYSPITAARFAGVGNLALALLLVTAIVGAAGLWVVRPDAPRRVLLAIAAVGFALTIVVDGAPRFGSDLGGVLALVPALGLTWLLLAGRSVSWGKVAALIGAGIVAVAAFAAVDLARPEADRTHLGRFAQRVLDGEAGAILERKLVTNLAVLVNPGVILVTLVAAVAAVVAWRRSAPFAVVRDEVPGVMATVLGCLVGAILGFGVNDSGVVVPGMMLAVLVPWFAHLAFEVVPAERP